MAEGETERMIGILIARGTPVLTSYLLNRHQKPLSEYYKEEAEKIQEIADRMARQGQAGKEFPCPVEDPEFASRIVREVFEETKKEIGDEHEMSKERMEDVKEKVKMRVMRKLRLER